MKDLTDWIGREQLREDIVSSATVARFSATFDGVGGSAPFEGRNPLMLWSLCTDAVAHSALGSDGHPELGDFLPPVEMPRRMWAGSELKFHAPLTIGAHIVRSSRISSIKERSGSSGRLVLVSVEHRVSDGKLLVEERQDIVYRGAPSEAKRSSIPPEPEDLPDVRWSDQIEPSTVLLARYSAITFNAHRIHYDRDYAIDVEGYPALVVHGPLVATLLLDLFIANNPSVGVRGFKFRARAPLFDNAPFVRVGWPTPTGAEVRAIDSRGVTAMVASVLA